MPDGLSKAEAHERLAQYGPNEIAEHKTNPLLKFLSYFWGPIPWMIEIAVILSGAVGHWPDFFIILLLLVANGVVGYTEERQAGNAIEALKAKLAINARVKRDGKWVTTPARELVPGDVIRLRLGDIVPADARLLDGDEIEVDQSALTGESLPATCTSGDAVFSGSIVSQGEIGALVYATGTRTYFGKTAELVADAHTVSHFQRAVLKIGNYLIILAVALVTRHRRRVDPARRRDPDHAAVRSGVDCCGDSGGDANRAVGDDGRRRTAARQERSHREPTGRHRGTRGRGRAVRGQDGYLDPELSDIGHPVHHRRRHVRDRHPRCRVRLPRGQRRPHRPRGARRSRRHQCLKVLYGNPFQTLRPGAQTHRGHRHRYRRDHLQGQQGRPAGHPGAGRERRADQTRR